ncbi:hypothetical protein RGU72_01350 [Undibacterium sp. 5I1]|uniref:hypothetical protein n=1 Tax=Undibacterium sp. 5I1 TaxID=3048590 RepID=UPI002AB56F1C|nr:hypothetical protein [Undibacterium sp. 5I1]MDY7536915.1 hypothetical protein [Undibacterium sp. 5I1]
MPKVHDASITDTGKFCKPDCKGCTINGKLKITGPATKPTKLNISVHLARFPASDQIRWVG